MRLRASATAAAMTMMIMATIATTSVRSGTADSTIGLVLGLGEPVVTGVSVGATVGEAVVGGVTIGAAATTMAPVSAFEL